MDKIQGTDYAQRINPAQPTQPVAGASGNPTGVRDVFQVSQTDRSENSPPATGGLQPPLPSVLSQLREAQGARGPADLNLQRLPADVPLTRDDFKRAAVIQHAGEEIARMHASAKEAPARGGLFCIRDALARIDNVANNPKKAELSRFDSAEARRIVEQLGEQLSEAAPRHLLMDYNYYPSAMKFAGSSRGLHVQADHSGRDYHAFFEPLARLSYTARLDPPRAETLLHAYSQQKAGRPANESELQAMRKANYVLDLTYYHYFIDVALQPPDTGSEKGIVREQALQSAKSIVQRIHADQDALAAPRWHLQEVEGV